MNENKRLSRALVHYVLFSAIGTLVTAVLLFVDDRVLAGEPVWLKPLKFFLSSGLYAATLEFGFRRVEGYTTRLNIVRRIVSWGLAFEMLAICGQAARGVKSHFNFATPLDAAVFTAMGVVISVVVIAAYVGVLHMLFGRFRGSRALREAFLSGFAVFTVAAFLGAAMASPTAEQAALLQEGRASPILGSHFVGSVEGSARTLPLTGWNAEGGDLRVAHFVGMHVIHLLLAMVWLMARRGVDLDSRRAVLGVRAAAVLGGVAMGWVFLQAKAGQSVVEMFSPSDLFSVANMLVLPFWILLIFLPRARLSGWVLDKRAPVALLALFYAAVVVPVVFRDPSVLAALARPTLEGVQALLSSPFGAAAGWIHFLCFDLFVGLRIREQALKRGQSFLWVSPLLGLVLMLGPLGWLGYSAVSLLTFRGGSNHGGNAGLR
jgi:hypothetical protein